MKKNLIYAFLSAIALFGATGFSACSSSDEVVDNPNYDPETNTVKTQLAISLPDYVGKSGTRQTAAVVQTSNNFRGMDNMWLIAFASEVDGSSPTVSPYRNSIHNLPAISTFDKDPQKAMVYNDLSIPVGTGAFMFYGKAQDNGSDPFFNGLLIAPSTFAGTVSSYNFYLQSIYGSGEVPVPVPDKATHILDYLKSIRSVTVANATLQAYLHSFQPVSGSSASVQAAVQNLYDNVKASSADAADKTAVYNAIKGTSTVYAEIENDVVTLTNDNILGYPANINLPDGAAVINWSNAANPTIQTTAFGSMNIPSLDRYVYPPSLYYRTNTSIGVSNNPSVSTTYGNDSWANIVASDKYVKNAKVDVNTRSIALLKQIQYAVGRLDLTIQAGAEKLKDSKGVEVTVPDAGFPVSAVLVGGQGPVGYNFEPSGVGNQIIYDRIMNTSSMSAKSGTPSAVNHTLVLETSTADIYIAIELTNNSGVQFQGKDGFVPKGGKFYLIGKVTLTDGKDSNNNPRTKIFEQDYITKVNFTIDPNAAGGEDSGLGAAYNVIPDLKDTDLEVAFSVDLEWIPGLTFNIQI